MDRQVEVATSSGMARPSYSSGHLMCRAMGWGVMGFLACGYFAWISFSYILRSQYDWPHDGWTAATYVVWIILLVGLMLDTHCLRERLFFGVLVVNFVIGFGLTLWQTVSLAQMHNARIGTGALWAVAALLSLTTVGRAGAVGSRSSPL